MLFTGNDGLEMFTFYITPNILVTHKRKRKRDSPDKNERWPGNKNALRPVEKIILDF